MVAFYSISDGIAFGIISYVVLNLVCSAVNLLLDALRKPLIKTKPVSILMIGIAIAFVLKYALL